MITCIEDNASYKAGYPQMPIRVNVVKVWLSSFLPPEEKIAKYPPTADATTADRSKAAGIQKIKKPFFSERFRIVIYFFTLYISFSPFTTSLVMLYTESW